VRTQKNGQSVAYLYASPDAPKEKLLELRAALRLKGWGTLSDHRDEKFALRVSGIRNSNELVELLSSSGYAKGTPTLSQDAPEKEKPMGLIDGIRNNSLRNSGMIATVGNLMSIASGFHRGKEIGQIGQGAAFAIADLPLALAGEKDDSRQMGDLLRRLKKHYDKNGIAIPANAAIHAETSDKGKGFGEQMGDYMHRYANQIKCSMEVVAAFFTFHAGKKQNSRDKMIAASIFGPGFLASLLIPEKNIAPEKYAQAGTLGRAWMQIQAHPLSIGGLLGYSNTFYTYKSAFSEQKRELAKKALGQAYTQHYRWDFAIPSVMIGANGLYAISPKTTGGDIRTTDMISDVYRIASQVINKLPEDQREAALESTAKFLGERPEVRDTYAQVRERLTQEMAIQRKNPWFENIVLPPAHKKASMRIHPATLPDVAEAPSTSLQAGAIEHQAKGIAAANDAQHALQANGR
jgi:hypothetical protein